MEVVGFAEEEVHGIFEIIAAILHLGNVGFDGSTEETSSEAVMVKPSVGNVELHITTGINIHFNLPSRIFWESPGFNVNLLELRNFVKGGFSTFWNHFTASKKPIFVFKSGKIM